jgi:hypothetical protein
VIFFPTPATGVNVEQILSDSLFAVLNVVEAPSELTGALVGCGLALGFFSTEQRTERLHYIIEKP